MLLLYLFPPKIPSLHRFSLVTLRGSQRGPKKISLHPCALIQVSVVITDCNLTNYIALAQKRLLTAGSRKLSSLWPCSYFLCIESAPTFKPVTYSNSFWYQSLLVTSNRKKNMGTLFPIHPGKAMLQEMYFGSSPGTQRGK